MTSWQANLDWNAVAPLNNSSCFVVAAGPVHDEISWLNDEAPLNIPQKDVTLDVSQFPMGWLNAEADSNNASIFVTDDVSHREISPSNVVLPKKP